MPKAKSQSSKKRLVLAKRATGIRVSGARALSYKDISSAREKNVSLIQPWIQACLATIYRQACLATLRRQAAWLGFSASPR